MSAYIHGSLALEEKRKQKVKIKETITIVNRRKSLPVQEKLLYLFTVLLCIVVAGTIIWRYAQIYEMNTSIHKIEQQIKVLQIENSKLKLEVGKLQDPKRLQEEAAKIGLGPNDDQLSQIPTSIPGKGNSLAAAR